MITVAHLQTQLHAVLGTVADQAGRATGFIRRQRKLTGSSFTQALVWGWLADPQATLADLSQMAALCGVQISTQGLEQRLTASAGQCLRHVLEASLVLVAQGATPSHSFLTRFNGVYLLDSSVVALPAALASVWPGCGNQNGCSAALKLQTLWEYQSGALHFSLHSGRDHDRRLPVPRLPAGALRLSDTGYFAVEEFQQLEAQGCFYLTRVPAKVHVFLPSGKHQRLSLFLRRHAQPTYDGWITLTAKGLRCRLLAEPAPPAVVAQRQQRLRERAKRKGQAVSREALALAAWTVVITNLDVSALSADEAWMLLRLRWQIELLFKLFKQQARLARSSSHQPERILCEIYAKLIGLILQHAVVLATAWDVPHRSLVKIARTVRHFTCLLAYSLQLPSPAFGHALQLLASVVPRACRLNKRKTQPSHFQRLLRLS
jgi:hypothetical protein